MLSLRRTLQKHAGTGLASTLWVETDANSTAPGPPLPPLPPHPDSGRGNWALLGPCRSRSRASAALQEIICFCMKMTEEGECCYFEICKLV